MDSHDINYRIRRILENTYRSRPKGEFYYRLNSEEENNISLISRHFEYKSGFLPMQVTHIKPFFYAENFVVGIDKIAKCLIKLKKLNTIFKKDSSYLILIEDFINVFSNTKDIRDSVSHPEDRARRKDKNNKQIVGDPGPPDLFAGEPAPVFFKNALMGNGFVVTNEKGHHTAIEISIRTLKEVEKKLQQIIDCIDWKYENHNRTFP